MKAITIWQPWASLIACGAKRYETRSWATKYRGPIAIHAAKAEFKPWHFELIDSRFVKAASKALETPDMSIYLLPLGKVIAIADLVDCIKITDVTGIYVYAGEPPHEHVILRDSYEFIFGDWAPGRYAWELKNVRQLATPIPAKGAQRLWNWDETPHLVAIDPWVIGDTNIWTPEGVRSGKRVALGREDAVMGLEVA